MLLSFIVIIIIHYCYHYQVMSSLKQYWKFFLLEIAVLSCISSSCVYATRKLQKLQSPVGDCNFEAFFFCFWLILTTKITLKKNSFICMLVRCVNTNFIFCWGFSANFCGYGTQNSKNTKSGIFPKIFNKIPWFLVW